PEIDCVRHLLPGPTADMAERRSDRVGHGADRVLIASGQMREETFVRALAASLGVAFQYLDGMPRSACALTDDRLPSAATAGLLPLRLAGELVWVVARRS